MIIKNVHVFCGTVEKISNPPTQFECEFASFLNEEIRYIKFFFSMSNHGRRPLLQLHKDAVVRLSLFSVIRAKTLEKEHCSSSTCCFDCLLNSFFKNNFTVAWK